jgi:hypothetical protein
MSQPPRLSITHSPSDLITSVGPSQQKADAVVENAERQAGTSGSNSSRSQQQQQAHEAAVPERHIATVQSPPSQSPSPSLSSRGGGGGGGDAKGGSGGSGDSSGATATLPVVEEVGESGSVGGRSTRSSVGVSGAGSEEEGREAERRKIDKNEGGVQKNETKTPLANGDVGSSASATA